MTDIITAAKELGELIKNGEIATSYRDTLAEYNNSKSLAEDINVYNATQASLGQARAKEDDNLVGILEERINEIYDKIMADPVFIRFTKAKNDMEALMNDVSNTIGEAVFGKREDSCSHDCGCCSGSCSH